MGGLGGVTITNSVPDISITQVSEKNDKLTIFDIVDKSRDIAQHATYLLGRAYEGRALL